MPIENGTLDNDKDVGDVPVEVTPDSYIEAQDALITAIQNDSGLTVAEINNYLPFVLSTLSNAALAFPAAGPVISAVLKVIPKQLP